MSATGVKTRDGVTTVRALPGYASFEAVGEMGSLAVRTLREAVRAPYPWWRDCVVEGSKAVRRCFVPLLLSHAALTIGYVIVFFGGLLEPLGASDRQGGAAFAVTAREFALWIGGMIVAGVAGSAVTADVAARKVRDELDALSVLGVDVLRSLVVPRVIGVTIASVALGVVGLLLATAVNYAIAPAYLDIPAGVFRDSVIHSVLPSDLLALVIKTSVVGFLVGLIACHKGLSARGGAEGVGRAVNQAVVILFVAIWLWNSVSNLAYLSLFPQVAVPRG